MSALIKLPNSLELIKLCWLVAEGRVCNLISEKYHAHDEVFITRLLFGEVKEEFNKANELGLFEQSFENDLLLLFNEPTLRDDVRRLSTGIIAHITYHEPQMERISGGDFGLAVIRPNVQKIKQGNLRESMHQQGLLCQAKRQTIKGDFGYLTDRQKEVLPNHLDYLAVLLYKYSDTQRIILQPFEWSDCKWNDIDDVVYFLANYLSAKTTNSGNLLTLLGEGIFGTADARVIESVICPDDIPHIKIQITWRDGPPPPPIEPGPQGLYRENPLQSQYNISRNVPRPNIQRMRGRLSN